MKNILIVFVCIFLYFFIAESYSQETVLGKKSEEDNIIKTAGQENIEPSNWCDDFDGNEIDTKMPEPCWTIVKNGSAQIWQSDGLLHLTGGKGHALSGVCNEAIRMYTNFSIHSKLIIKDPKSTIPNQESNAEIRFRVVEGTGYSLSLKAGDKPPLINLRRSDNWQVIQNKSIPHNFSAGENIFINIDCKVSKIVINIGTEAGAKDIVSWEFYDPSFSKGSFWIQNYQMSSVDVDYFYVLPSGANPFSKSKPAMISPKTN